MADFRQMNPPLDKMASRLGYAGSGSLSPILAGLKGRFTFSPDSTYGATLTPVTIKCYDKDMTTATAKDWSSAISFPIVPGPTYYDGRVDVTFGNASFTFTGATATRNILEWTTNVGTCRRQFWVMDPPTTEGIYVDNQNASDVSNPARVFVDPTAAKNAGAGFAQGETDHSAWWDKNLSFSINMLPGISDEFYQQQEHFVESDQSGASLLHRGWGNRYANTIKNWGGAKTVEVFRGSESDAIIPESYVSDIHGFHWGVVSEAQLTTHTLTFRLRALPESSTYVDMKAYVKISRLPCP